MDRTELNRSLSDSEIGLGAKGSVEQWPKSYRVYDVVLNLTVDLLMSLINKSSDVLHHKCSSVPLFASDAREVASAIMMDVCDESQTDAAIQHTRELYVPFSECTRRLMLSSLRKDLRRLSSAKGRRFTRIFKKVKIDKEEITCAIRTGVAREVKKLLAEADIFLWDSNPPSTVSSPCGDDSKKVLAEFSIEQPSLKTIHINTVWDICLRVALQVLPWTHTMLEDEALSENVLKALAEQEYMEITCNWKEANTCVEESEISSVLQHVKQALQQAYSPDTLRIMSQEDKKEINHIFTEHVVKGIMALPIKTHSTPAESHMAVKADETIVLNQVSPKNGNEEETPKNNKTQRRSVFRRILSAIRRPFIRHITPLEV